jgi:DnaJ-class molecular chaperone
MWSLFLARQSPFLVSPSFLRYFEELSSTNHALLGYVQTIKDEGMPMHEFPSQRGNLYVEYTVVFPQKLSEAQKEGKELRYLWDTNK